jgi:hypothetical protein
MRDIYIERLVFFSDSLLDYFDEVGCLSRIRRAPSFNKKIDCRSRGSEQKLHYKIYRILKARDISFIESIFLHFLNLFLVGIVKKGTLVREIA